MINKEEEKNIAMTKDEGKNNTVWCGVVAEAPVYSHPIKDKETGEIIEDFQRFILNTEVKTNKGKVLDVSNLPLIVSQKHLNELGREIKVGDVLFIRGSWRAYTVEEGTRRRTEQVGYVQHIEFTEITEEKGKYLNRFDFEGYLVSKLYEPVRDENSGKPKRYPNGTFIPLLDENGKKQYTTRLNKEKKVVNDFTIAINKKGNSFYIPSLAYFNLAKKVANDIPVGAKVKGSGYVRSRYVEEIDKTVYEAVIVSLDVIPENKENENN